MVCGAPVIGLLAVANSGLGRELKAEAEAAELRTPSALTEGRLSRERVALVHGSRRGPRHELRK